jgi:hypothetical protein
MSIIDHVKDAIVRADNAWDGNVPVSRMEYLARAAVKATLEGLIEVCKHSKFEVTHTFENLPPKLSEALVEMLQKDCRDATLSFLNAAISETEG